MEVGRLTVPIGADLGPVKKDLDELKRLLERIGGRGGQSPFGELERQVERSRKSVNSLTAALRPLAAALGTVLGAALSYRSTVSAFADFETALIGVGKTSDITGAELEELGRQVQLISRDVPLATNQLLEIAQAAGQLGVSGSENILRFTKTVGQLGLASNLSGEAAATSLARILTVSGTAISDVDRLASTIVRLGNNFAATESEIADASTRVAQATAQFGVSAADIAGISTALRAVGVEAENGGSSVGRAMQAINDAVRNGGKELRNLERITGETGESLRTLFQTDPTAAFQKLVEGLGRISKAGGDVTAALDALGLSDIRLIQVLGTLAVRSEVLNEALVAANDEWEKNTALVNEANTAGQSFTSQITIMFNAMTELGVAIGKAIAPSLIPVINAIAAAFQGWADNSDMVIDTLTRIGIYVATGVVGWGAYTAAIYASNLASITLAGTLALLRTALIRVGIGALIVAAGELVYQFTKLVERAGGLGNAFSLLGEVAIGVWEGITTSAQAIPPALQAAWLTIQADFIETLNQMKSAWNDFLATFEGPALTATIGGRTFELIGGLDLSRFKADIDDAGGAVDDFRSRAEKLRTEAANLATEGFDKAAESLRLLIATGQESQGGRTRYRSGSGAGESTPPTAPGLPPELDTGGSSKLSKAEREAKRLAEAYKQLVDDGVAFIEMQEIERQTIGLSAIEADKLRARFELLNDARRAGIELTPDEIAALEALADAQVEAKHTTDNLREAYEFSKDVFKGFFTDLVGELRNGASLWEALGNAGANALQKIADKALDLALNGIFDLIFNAFGSGGGFGSIIKNLFKAENGTSFAPGGVTLVGERGPELVNLPGGAQVTPNNRVTAPMQASFGNGSGTGGTQRLALDVFVKDNGKIGAIARQEAAGVVEVAIHDYDQALPDRLEDYNRNPRQR